VGVQPVPSLAAAAQSTCRALTQSLPRSVASGATRRATDPADGTTAAWGDPPIVLRCGTAAGSPLDDLYVFDGVQWAMHDTGATRTWTTMGRRVEVQVVIPDHYDGQAEILGGLAGPLAVTAR
jgi:hypothetical protein